MVLKSFNIKGDAPRLVMLGNSNVGKSTFTRYFLKNKKLTTGQIGKHAGSTVSLKIYKDKGVPYQIIDLPGFGAMTKTGRTLKEKIHDNIVKYVEKDKKNIFLALVILNSTRILDELDKWYYKNKNTIPLSYEFVTWLNELKIPTLLIINKIDKVKKRELTLILEKISEVLLDFGVTIQEDTGNSLINGIKIQTTSAKNDINMAEVKKIIQNNFETKFGKDCHWMDFERRIPQEDKNFSKKQTKAKKKKPRKSRK